MSVIEFNLAITGLKRKQAEKLLDIIVLFTESHGGTVGGGLIKVPKKKEGSKPKSKLKAEKS